MAVGEGGRTQGGGSPAARRSAEFGGDHRGQREVRVVALEHLQGPLGGEQRQQLAVGALQHLDVPGGGELGRGLPVGDPGDLVGEWLQGDPGAELVLHAVAGHLELHGPTTANTGAPSPRRWETSTWTTPSPPRVSMPLRNCLYFDVSAARATAKCSGAKVVMGG